MNLSAIGPSSSTAVSGNFDRAEQKPSLREAFDNFVGETFFNQMLSSMRKTVGKPAYFYGGRAEEIFQGQLDQILATELTQTSGHSLSGPMYELFSVTRQ
jgi:Rod binding domain-containing protein